MLVHLILTLEHAGALEWNAPADLCPPNPPTALDVLRPAGLATPCVRIALPLKKKNSVWSLTQFKSAGDRYTLTCGGYVRVALRRAYALEVPHAWPRDRGRRAFIYLHVLLARAVRRPPPLLGPLDWANALLFRAGLCFSVWKNHYTTAKGTRHAEKRKARGADAAAPPHPQPVTPLPPSSTLRSAMQQRQSRVMVRARASRSMSAASCAHADLRAAPRQRPTSVLCTFAQRAAAYALRTWPGRRRRSTTPW